MTNSDPVPDPSKFDIAILCADENSNYFHFPDLDIYTKSRPIAQYDGNGPVITHAPCAQWSRLHTFAHNKPDEKELAWKCLNYVHRNGGIFEHPAGSHFFREAGITPTLAIDLHYFGFPARKTTWLYFHRCEPIAFPLNFDAIRTKVQKLHSSKRSATPLAMCQWLLDCIRQTHL